MKTAFFNLKPLRAAYDKRESLILRLIEIGATFEWQGFAQGMLKANNPRCSGIPITLKWRQSKPLFGRQPDNANEDIDICDFLMNPRPPREVRFEHAGDPMYHGNLSLPATLRIAGQYLRQGYAGDILISTSGRGSHPSRFDLRLRFADFGESFEDGDGPTERLRVDYDSENPMFEPLLRLGKEFKLKQYRPATTAA